MKRLEQEGIFKMKPLSWDIREAESGAVAVSMSFKVLEELVDGKWESWATYEEHMVYGDWWVVKKDGTINEGAVEQLATSLGWDGNLASVTGTPPEKIVQVLVKPDTYEGVTRYKGSWMNPEDYTGGAPGAADPATVKGLQTRFGSLLRAAAAGAKAGAPKPVAKAPSKAGPKPKAAPAPESPPMSNEEHAAKRKAAGLPSESPLCPVHKDAGCPSDCTDGIPF